MDIQNDEEVMKINYSEEPYMGPSTSNSYTNYEMLDIEAASKNHINEGDIEDEPLYNIMDDMSEKDDDEEDGKHMKDKSIVLQIVNDRGNLKVKKSKADDSSDSSDFDRFQCEICFDFFLNLSELFEHVKRVHEDVQIPQEYEQLLINQLVAIDKMRSAAFGLINDHRYGTVEKLLATSRDSLESLKMDVFGMGETNVFRYYIPFIFKQIYEHLKETRTKESEEETSAKKSNTVKESVGTKVKKSVKKNHKQKITKKNNKKAKHNQTKMEFSSEDELSLRETINKSNNNITKQQNESEELYLQFYAVPFKPNGDEISLYEMESLRAAIKSMWNGVRVDMSSFSDIMVRRYEREVDEILPEDALYGGYALKENTSIFREPKLVTDIFDENLLLNDGIHPHKTKIKKALKKSTLTIEKCTNSDVSVDANGENDKSDSEAVFNRLAPVSNSDDDDSYDDGFEKATNYLVLASEDRKPRDLNYFEKCDMCDETFLKKKLLLQHVRKQHGEAKKLYVCKVCGCKILPRSKLWEHFKLHTGGVIHECELCCETFACVEEKEDHLKSKHADSELVCFLCKAQFTEITELQAHFIKEHSVAVSGESSSTEPSDSTSRPACNICNRTFSSLGRLSQHLTTAHQDKKIKKK